MPDADAAGAAYAFEDLPPWLKTHFEAAKTEFDIRRKRTGGGPRPKFWGHWRDTLLPSAGEQKWCAESPVGQCLRLLVDPEAAAALFDRRVKLAAAPAAAEEAGVPEEGVAAPGPLNPSEMDASSGLSEEDPSAGLSKSEGVQEVLEEEASEVLQEDAASGFR